MRVAGFSFRGDTWREHADEGVGTGKLGFSLTWLKKYLFFPQATFLPFPYMVVGLSYVFFRVLHLVIDAQSGACRIGRVRSATSTTRSTSLR